MTALLDGNLLVGLVLEAHVFHPAARRWLVDRNEPFLTCPITQGTLLRVTMHQGFTMDQALASLAMVTEHPRHTFVADDIGYDDVDLAGVVGHRQITDAYLVALARRHDAVVATFDRGLAALHPTATELVG